MGVAKANEVLIFGKKLTAQEMLECGFVKSVSFEPPIHTSELTPLCSKIFPSQPVEAFHSTVRAHIQSELDSLEPSAVLRVKELMKIGFAEANNPDAVNLRESYAQAERISSGIAAERFGKVARKEIRHKL